VRSRQTSRSTSQMRGSRRGLARAGGRSGAEVQAAEAWGAGRAHVEADDEAQHPRGRRRARVGVVAGVLGAVPIVWWGATVVTPWVTIVLSSPRASCGRLRQLAGRRLSGGTGSAARRRPSRVGGRGRIVAGWFEKVDRSRAESRGSGAGRDLLGGAGGRGSRAAARVALAQVCDELDRVLLEHAWFSEPVVLSGQVALGRY
jgi:hypothetical protein